MSDVVLWSEFQFWKMLDKVFHALKLILAINKKYHNKNNNITAKATILE